MKVLYIVKVGTTFPATAKRFGDFDRWTREALGESSIELRVVDVEHGAALPPAEECAGAVITGSHAMVTDNLPWSLRTERWITSLLRSEVPIFGICYGHQLLARAAGGEVGYHPHGQEIGTVQIELLDAAADDVVFGSLPRRLLAHATHTQTVLRLPPGAVHLATNDFEPNHAFRIGRCAWGVQFHPEYNAAIMRSYIDEQAEKLGARGIDTAALRSRVADTPESLASVRSFARYAEAKAFIADVHIGDFRSERG